MNHSANDEAVHWYGGEQNEQECRNNFKQPAQ